MLYARDIDWDTDGQEVDLPSSVPIPLDLYEEDVADYLSNMYGFCIFSLDVVEKTVLSIVFDSTGRYEIKKHKSTEDAIRYNIKNMEEEFLKDVAEGVEYEVDKKEGYGYYRNPNSLIETWWDITVI